MMYAAQRIVSPYDFERPKPERYGVSAFGSLFGGGSHTTPQDFSHAGPSSLAIAKAMQQGGLPFMQNFKPPFQPQGGGAPPSGFAPGQQGLGQQNQQPAQGIPPQLLAILGGGPFMNMMR